jgi:uncharacterized protein
MPTIPTSRLAPVLLIGAGTVFAAAPPADATRITVGTASPEGLYYQVGRAICRLVNEGTAEHGFTCEAEPTDGSIFNLRAVLGGTMDIGVVQSDWQFHAYRGTDVFADDGRGEALRALFSVHAEPFTAVAREDAGIRAFDEFKGKRVNIGNPGSGQRATMEVVMRAQGWTRDDFLLAEELPAAQHSLALCHDRVQALVYTVGHPNPSINQVTELCDARIVPVTGPAIEKLIEDHPFYVEATIPGGFYPNNPDPVPTFGVKATVVSSEAVDPEVVYTVVRAVFDNLDEFRAMQSAWNLLDPEVMVSDGLSAPLHEGALRYYREAGLLPEEPAPEPQPEAEPAEPEPEEEEAVD